MRKIIKNGYIVLEDKIIQSGFLTFSNGKITDIGRMEDIYNDVEFDQVIDVKGKIVLPGFIDEHIHGANGFDVMDGTLNALEGISVYLVTEGVTSFLLTTMTESEKVLDKALRTSGEYIVNQHIGIHYAEALGIHLEGPFISCEFSGGQNKKYIQKPSIQQIKHYNDLSQGQIKKVTYAPENADIHFTKYLSKNKIVPSVGHSNATHKEIKKHINAGLSNVTHIFNAMSPVHHRNPGVAFSGLKENLFLELICDGRHVDLNVVSYLFSQKGASKISLVSDSMRAKNCQDGKYIHGGQIVEKKDNIVVLPDGTLCGSVLKIPHAIQKIKKITKCTLVDIGLMTSLTPAKSLGLSESKGSLKVGKDADIVIVDKKFNVFYTFVKGKLKYKYTN